MPLTARRNDYSEQWVYHHFSEKEPRQAQEYRPFP